VSEFLGGGVDAPEFVPAFVAGDEDAVLVPAVDPGDAVVELKEASLYSFASVIFNFNSPLPALVIVFQEITP
jgi:hypothetical protein